MRTKRLYLKVIYLVKERNIILSLTIKKYLLIVLMIIAILVISGCVGQSDKIGNLSDNQTAKECAPAQCCHSTSCVLKEQAPDCSQFACTQECAPGTMDCVQGYCEFSGNKCIVVWTQ
ncbi:MAG: hypothetical protein HZB65_01890 [Candidatus Aenigmarchaeota archaeon]|nr:hypothetical protein [Candidatus Aenigmarchaeota archaeon]